MIDNLKKIFSNKFIFLLLLLIIFHIISNLIYIFINKAPPTWDSAGHLTLSFILLDKLKLISLGRFNFLDFMRISNYYPPLVHIIGAIIMLLLGRSFEFSLFLTGTIFLVVAIVFLYKIILFHFKENYKLAFFTVLIFSFFPQIWEQSRQFHLDVPLCALLLIAYYYLLLSNSLKNRFYSFVFFILLSLVQLTKWYGFIYLIVPFVNEVVLKGLKSKDLLTDKKRLVNILLGYILVLIVALPWYVLNFQSILSNIAVSATADAGDPITIFSVENWFHYVKLMMSYQLGFLSVLVLFVSWGFMFLRKVPFKSYIIWLVVTPYVCFSLIQNKDLRYILPLTSIFAFCIAYLLGEFAKKYTKSLTIGYVVYLLFLFFFLSLNQYKTLPPSLNFIAWVMGGPYKWAWINDPSTLSYNPHNWMVEDMLKEIAKEASQESTISGTYKILEVSDNKYYSIATFDMYKMQGTFYDMDLVVPYNKPDKLSPTELTEYLSSIQFAIVPVIPGPSGLRNIVVLNQLVDYFTSSDNTDFASIRTYDMPDGNKVYLYKRVNYLSFKNPEKILDDSLKIYLSNILFLDSEKIKTQVFEIHAFDEAFNDKVYKLGTDGVTQKRIPLEGIAKFRIDLPREQLDVKHMTGWAFRDMYFIRIPSYSVNTYVFKEGVLKPLNTDQDAFASKLLSSISTFVSYTNNSIKIINKNPNESVYISYAVKGWKWTGFWLKDKGGEVLIPAEDLIQIDITQPNQMISDFPSNWGFFPCYDGKAVCFYPIVEGL